jgi:ribonuclease BN (tRNA processing enzyme)
LAQFNLPWFDVTHIAITHFHVDHFGELPALLFALKYGAPAARTAPLTLIGPVGFKDRLDRLAAAFGDWVTEPGWPLQVVEMMPATPLGLGDDVELEAFHTPHTDESLAYSIRTGGSRLVYTGDTGPSEQLGAWASGCDLLVAECSLPDHMAMPIHLTPTSAGALAERARAKRLVLTHLYPPVEGVDILGAVKTVYQGPVAVAGDGDRFEVGFS